MVAVGSAIVLSSYALQASDADRDDFGPMSTSSLQDLAASRDNYCCVITLRVIIIVNRNW